MPDAAMILAALAVMAGSAVQGSVGFGMGLLATPFVMLVDPTLMPGSLLVVAAALAGFGFIQERSHVVWSQLGWALGGRAIGTVGGAYVVVIASPRALGAVAGVVVLTGVALTSWVRHVPKTRAALVTAGAVSGVTATAASIGGPPIALLYQNDHGRTIRANLAAFFLVGAVGSLGALAVAGQLPLRVLVAGALMAPFMALGFWLAQPLRRHLNAGRTRWAVLFVAAASAIVLLIRSAF